MHDSYWIFSMSLGSIHFVENPFHQFFKEDNTGKIKWSKNLKTYIEFKLFQIKLIFFKFYIKNQKFHQF